MPGFTFQLSPWERWRCGQGAVQIESLASDWPPCLLAKVERGEVLHPSVGMEGWLERLLLCPRSPAAQVRLCSSKTPLIRRDLASLLT